ncbi:MAG: hypothetical protein L0191_10075 [Acidobacteria bacterium]|nr:hypothetical protein [Acidobacteriota bacterium]
MARLLSAEDRRRFGEGTVDEIFFREHQEADLSERLRAWVERGSPKPNSEERPEVRLTATSTDGAEVSRRVDLGTPLGTLLDTLAGAKGRTR